VQEITRVGALVADPRFPTKYGAILIQFFDAYRAALLNAGLEPARFDHLLGGLVDRLTEQLDSPFTFEPFHRQITAPFDYYQFGVEFLRPLVDLSKSSVHGRANLDQAAAQRAAGHNVIFLANHQTEGDPQAISLLLEDTHADLGKEMIFVAGERVTTDPLAVPFSMGRNLLCIYSKRYIEHPPERRGSKQQHNRRTMERMGELLSEGGQCIYAAPSGGRDRADAAGRVEVAPFDAPSVEMYYVMAKRANRPSHFYPMALGTYEFLPPPETIQVELGEARLIKRTGIHLAVGQEVDMERAALGAPDKHSGRLNRAASLWRAVVSEYNRFRLEPAPRSAAG
jgi:glycerol-3-phosphate O-acyltransferase